jgi:hypothetical protein
MGVEVGFDGLEIRHASRDDAGSDSGATELKASFDLNFSCFCKRIRLVVDVRIIGGGLPVSPRTAFSFELASVPEASVSMSAALRGEKKFRVTNSFGWMYKAVDVLVCTVAFFELPVVSPVARLFRLPTSWN